MKKIGVFGGTFDPIHIGHIYIAYEAYKILELDEVIFMPAGNPPHKKWKDITGADCLVNLNSWKNINEIFKFSNLVVFNRPGFDKNDLLKRKEEFDREYCTNIVYLDLLNIEISSTLIRERVRESLEVKFFLPPGVVDIIDKYNLYRRE